MSVQGDSALDGILSEAYQLTDDSLSRLSRWLPNTSQIKFRNKENYIDSLTRIRNQTDHLTYKEVIRWFADDISVFIKWMVDAVKEESESDIWAELVAFHMLINGKECIGVQLALGAYFYTHGQCLCS